MKCTVKVSDLWQAISSTFKINPSKDKAVALDCSDGKLRVLRTTASISTQYTINAKIEAPGRAVIADPSFLEFYGSGDEDEDVVLQDKTTSTLLVGNSKATISSKPLDFFNLLDPPEKFDSLSKNISRTLWISDEPKIRISGSIVEVLDVNGGPVTAWCTGGSPDNESIVVWAKSLGRLSFSDAEVSLSESHIWFREGGMLAKISAAYDSWDEELLLERVESLPKLGSVTINKVDFLRVLDYTKSLSMDEIWKEGMAFIEIKDDRFVVSTARRGAGEGKRELEDVLLDGDMRVKIFPGQYASALRSIKATQIALERKGNGIIIRGDNLIYAVAAITDPTMR